MKYTAACVVQWTPGSNNIEKFYKDCSVYVLPSDREGMPVTVMEAMATGRAIITTDVPGCRDMVKDGINGFVVPAKNPAAVAEAMLRFIWKPALLEEMGLAGRRMAEQRFDVRKATERQFRIVECAARGRKILK